LFDWSKHTEIPTNDLVECICWKGKGDEETEEIARRCFEIFFNRFKVDVTRKCEVLCTRWKHPPSVALSLVERTFKSFLHKGKFDPAKSSTEDYDTGIKLYLYRIAERELTDYYREQSGMRLSPYTGQEQLVYEVQELEAFKNNPEPTGKLKEYLELLEHALSGINDKHRLCYLTYVNAGVQPGKYPPRHLTKLLQEATGLSQVSIKSNVNRIRERVELIRKVYAKKK